MNPVQTKVGGERTWVIGQVACPSFLKVGETF
jgi:hypothetical protein